MWFYCQSVFCTYSSIFHDLNLLKSLSSWEDLELPFTYLIYNIFTYIFFLFLFLFVTFFSPFLFLFLTFLIENISRNRVSYVYYIDKRLRNLVIVSKILLIIIFPQNYCKINTIFIIFNLFIYPTICFQRLTHTVVPIFESWQIFFST